MVDALTTELQARYERLSLLYSVSKVIHSTLEPQDALQLILAEATRVMRASSGSIVLVNPTTGFLDIQAHRGLSAKGAKLKLRVGEGITGWVARTGKPARVGDVAADPRYVRARTRVRSELAVPLEVNGEVRGVVNVDSDRPDAFSVDDQQLLEELAGQAAKVIHHTWLYEQIRLRARLFESLISVGETINSTLSLDDALKAITKEACQLMGGKISSLLMLSEDAEWLEIRASYGAGPAYTQRQRLSMAESLMGIVMRRKKPLQVENVQVSTLYQHVETARREGLVSLLTVPLVFRSQAIGTLNVYTGEPRVFSNEEVRILSAVADLSAIAIEKARLYERIVEIEEQLRQKEKLSALGLLAAEVAHEIRNPLTVMKMLYHSLDLRFPVEDPRSKDAEILEQKMDHLNRIMDQILDFARSNEPKLAAVNLNQLIDDLRLLTRFKLSHNQVRLVLKLDPNLPPVVADASQLEQVFLNLTLNAIEAMPTGGRLTILSRPEPTSAQAGAPPQVLVEFRDTGTGMTREQRQNAFTSLLRTNKAKGTGLGLAIVAKVVEAHHGKVTLKSRPGRGTCISLILPCQAV